MEKLTVETFKEKVFDFETEKDWNFKGTKPAIIDFYADWCGPCKMVAPVLEELSVEFPNIDFYSVDTENQGEIAQTFNIRNIPALLFIPVTGTPSMAVGAVSKNVLKEAIKNALGVE